MGVVLRVLVQAVRTSRLAPSYQRLAGLSLLLSLLITLRYMSSLLRVSWPYRVALNSVVSHPEAQRLYLTLLGWLVSVVGSQHHQPQDEVEEEEGGRDSGDQDGDHQETLEVEIDPDQREEDGGGEGEGEELDHGEH